MCGKAAGSGDAMVVKEKRGRRRYIAFSMCAELTKDSLISALRRSCNDPPFVVQCAEGWAIIRCPHKDTDSVISEIKLADPSSEPLRTSGTIRTLRMMFPELERLRPKKRV